MQTERQVLGGRDKKAGATEEGEGEPGSPMGVRVSRAPPRAPAPHFLERQSPTHDNGCHPSERFLVEFSGLHP